MKIKKMGFFNFCLKYFNSKVLQKKVFENLEFTERFLKFYHECKSLIIYALELLYKTVILQCLGTNISPSKLLKSCIQTNFIAHIANEEILDIINSLENKSTGPSSIPVKLLLLTRFNYHPS